jgi:hypothetical protein
MVALEIPVVDKLGNEEALEAIVYLLASLLTAAAQVDQDTPLAALAALAEDAAMVLEQIIQQAPQAAEQAHMVKAMLAVAEIKPAIMPAAVAVVQEELAVMVLLEVA